MNPLTFESIPINQHSEEKKPLNTKYLSYFVVDQVLGEDF